ncbi:MULTISPECIES: hypothetical protein [unclassified Streptomyces]|uniref:hypothetical protein n=1 Tax=unclassified Streptomyces TaxID=2593676 RepID=UPI000823CDB6|nr:MULTISPECIES: hypothetical protein [unclassified Streptomyces]SCK23438.1 hypothetical protein YW7DRAFT_01770 [Streptomyces sp. AmelKG-E11A]
MARWTVHHEERVEVPATVDGIRAALTARQCQLFERELGGATVETVADVLRHWIQEVASDPEDEEVFTRLEAERSRL